MWEFLLLTLFADKQIIIQPLLLILQLFKFQAYLYQQQSDISSVLNHLDVKASSILHKEEKRGFFYGKWFLGYIHVSEGREKTIDMYLIIKKKDYEAIKKKEMEKFKKNLEECGKDADVKPQMVTTLVRMGHKWWFDWDKTENNYSYLTPIPSQQKIIDEVLFLYKKSVTKSITILIHGPPGLGKTMIGYLLAKHFESSYCDEWNPMEEGDRLILAMNKADPTPEKPMIVALDEVDKMIVKLDTLKPVKDVPRQIDDKRSWNRHFDNVNMGRYPSTITVMTMNIPPDMIGSDGNRLIDPSLIREGRVDRIFDMGEIDASIEKPKCD